MVDVVVCLTTAFPAMTPAEVVMMRADVAMVLVMSKVKMMKKAVSAATEGMTGESPAHRTVDRTRITSVEQLKSFFSRPLNG